MYFLGHIELLLPVYNPINFQTLFNILRNKCWSCHKFRIHKDKIRRIVLQLKLLDRGEIMAALNLNAELSGKSGNYSENATEQRARHEAIYMKYETLCENSPPKKDAVIGHARQQKRMLIAQFVKDLNGAKRCANCRAYTPLLRKDGHTKLFHKVV